MDIMTGHIPNKPRKVYRVALFLCLFFVGSTVLVGTSSMDGMGGKYALVFILGFAAVSAFVTAMMFIPRAREFDKLVNGLILLAHWKYSPDEWEKFLLESRKEMLIVNRATLRWASTISAVVGIILLLASRDSLFLIIIGGIILMMAAAAFLGPLIQTSLMKNEEREAFVGERSAFIGGSFYTWTQAGSRLTGAGIYSEDTPIAMLHIIYEYPTIRAFQQEIIRIPVPAGRMEEASKLVEILSKQTE
jgi:hypothetical protein